MDIRSAQQLAWENKVAKGLNTTDVPLEFCLLQGEIAQAFDAWRKGREDVGEELADLAIYLLGLAQMTGIDLRNEIEAKVAKNAERVYQRLPNGVLAKISGEADQSPARFLTIQVASVLICAVPRPLLLWTNPGIPYIRYCRCCAACTPLPVPAFRRAQEKALLART